MMKAPVKKGDTVVVMTGKDKGKRGRIIEVMLKKAKVKVEKVNIVKRHMKPSAKYRQGGIIEKEAPLDWSNVMLVCSRCNRGVRIRHKINVDGKKVRVCAKCGEEISAK